MIPRFVANQELKISDLNQLSDEIRAAQITSVMGGRFTRGPGGTALVIDPGTSTGGSSSTMPCPWQVSAANKSASDWRITIAWGLVMPQGVLPIGMQMTDDPPLDLAWTDGYVLMTVTFKANSTLIDTAKFEIKAAIPAQSENEAYYPIARLITKIDNAGQPYQKILNLCSAPVPSVCDLKYVAT